MDGSFWAGGFDFGSAISGIDEVLNQENFTLEEVLDNDDVITECKYQNSALIEVGLLICFPSFLQR